MITPCFSLERRRLQDTNGQLGKLYYEQSPDFELPVYMEMKAAQGTDLVWHVSDVTVAGGGMDACQINLANIRFRAQGSDPRWMADVLSDIIRVQSFEHLRTLNFSIERQESAQSVWRGTLKNVGDQSHIFRLAIRDQPCRDANNIWYRWTSELSLDGNIFHGCAREGNLTNRALLGRYSNELNDNEVFAVLDLRQNNSAKMLLDYRNGQPLIVMSGRWEWSDNNKLALYFTDQDGREQESILLLRRTRSGSFIQEGFSAEFGRTGFELKRSE
ncbi:hypothetical protein [Neptunomonas antarctica]|uniref:hypothetical protein n=1 Tax=Neptunomonas antarctica TaxID=619304 RepID=UPI0006C8110F|nr:hypothetical protein [Neptunomonas antarctica]